jgi:hypothetical protein
MKLVNLTPHVINIVGLDPIESSGLARVVENKEKVDTTNGIEINSVEYKNIEGLPAPEKNTYYIVSIYVANAAKEIGREDVLYPGDLLRDEKGRIVGCKNLNKLKGMMGMSKPKLVNIACECGENIELWDSYEEDIIFCECCGYDCLNVQEKLKG